MRKPTTTITATERAEIADLLGVSAIYLRELARGLWSAHRMAPELRITLRRHADRAESLQRQLREEK